MTRGETRFGHGTQIEKCSTRLAALAFLAVFLVISVLPAVVPAAQAEQVAWVLQFGGTNPSVEGARGVAADETGVYVVGSTYGTLPGQTKTGNEDAFIRKYDSEGNEAWTHQFGGGGDATAIDVATAGPATYVGGRQGGDALVRKYDTNGNEHWRRTFGAFGADDSVKDVEVTSTKVYVGGTSDGILPGQTEGGFDSIFLRQYDNEGNELWTRQFASGHSARWGGPSIAADSSGAYVSFLEQSGSTFRAFLRRYDNAGNVLWTRQLDTATFVINPGFVAADDSGVYWARSGGSSPDPLLRKYDQNGNEVWTVPSFDSVLAIAVDAFGIYLGGALTPHSAAVRTYDLNGNEMWRKEFGNSGSDIITVSSIASVSSRVFLAGHTLGTLPGQTSAGLADAWVQQYDAAGSLKWTRQFGGAGPASDSAQAAQAVRGEVYVVGATSGALPDRANAGAVDAFIRKYDSHGNELWTDQVGTSTPDFARAVAADDSAAYVVGETQSAFPGQPFSMGGRDVFIRKYDQFGNHLWTQQFGTSSSDFAWGAAVDSGGVYVVGSTGGVLVPGTTSAGSSDAYVRKYDFDGNHLWTRQFGSESSDVARDVQVDAIGIYVAGYTEGSLPGQTNLGGRDAFAVKFDPNGNPVWMRQFGGSHHDLALGIGMDVSGVYVVGETWSSLPGHTNAGLADAFIRKYDPQGSEVWTRQFGTTTEDSAATVESDALRVYVGGRTGAALPGQESAGQEDAFVRMYDLAGNEIWTHQFGSPQFDSALAITGDASGWYVAGDTAGALPGQRSRGGTDAYIVKFVAEEPQPPAVSITSPESGLVLAIGLPVTFEGEFTDQPGDSHTATWTFGSTTIPGTVTQGEKGGRVTDTFIFLTSGVYPVSLTVTDDTGLSGTASTVGGLPAFVVVYDPEGGFVTGGGWFDSPPGAYAPSPLITGKASFGFVSKYQKGARIPTGQTEFQFKLANLNLHSSEYEWLVVSGPKAQYKGVGTVNGIAGYGFMLTAVDGDLPGGGGQDRIRMKIWNLLTGEVLYDNQMGEDDFVGPTTPIGGGSIVIKKG